MARGGRHQGMVVPGEEAVEVRDFLTEPLRLQLNSMLKRLPLLLFILAAALPLSGQEYRGFWVETFNTRFGTHAEVDAIVDGAVRSNSNALFVQVRRRGDSWYLQSREPLTEVAGVGEPDANGRWTFDPLQDLIEQAHARGIEVHAFTIVTAVYRDDPATRLPADPNHVFLQHIWDRTSGAPYTDSRQWATRALAPNLDGITYDGQRFGTDWYIDLGHPDAAAYTVEVLTHLVSHYALDGLHLDRIRYPEGIVDRPTGEPYGANVGYNATSLARFNAKTGRTGNPKSNDPAWNDWRRQQVTDLVRRVYLSVKKIRPRTVVSGALITFGAGPTASGGFHNTETYMRVFQDWEGWAEEGIIDLLVPMIYKREHQASGVTQYDDWLNFLVQTAQKNNVRSASGIAAYLNGVEGTLRQARRARDAGADGVVFYSFATPSEAVTGNPYSYPQAGISTPSRSQSDFYEALVLGATSTTRFEPPSLTPLFPTPVTTPERRVDQAHVMGLVRSGSQLVDGEPILLERLGSGAIRMAHSDGSGFFGFADVEPARYRVRTSSLEGCVVDLVPGAIVTVDLPGGCGPRRRAIGW